jgi:hypothetical protein
MNLERATDLLGPAPTLAPCVATAVAQDAATGPGTPSPQPMHLRTLSARAMSKRMRFARNRRNLKVDGRKDGGHVGHNGNGSGSGNATARMRASVCKVVWLRWRIVSAGAH